MKTKIKRAHSQTIVGNGHGIFSRLRSLPIFTKQLPSPIPHCLPVNPLRECASQQRLVVEFEAKLNQETGRAYVNMLPPK